MSNWREAVKGLRSGEPLVSASGKIMLANNGKVIEAYVVENPHADWPIYKTRVLSCKEIMRVLRNTV